MPKRMVGAKVTSVPDPVELQQQLLDLLEVVRGTVFLDRARKAHEKVLDLRDVVLRLDTSDPRGHAVSRLFDYVVAVSRGRVRLRAQRLTVAQREVEGDLLVVLGEILDRRVRLADLAGRLDRIGEQLDRLDPRLR
ncbi:hypothetical protein [Nocardia asteroides]